MDGNTAWWTGTITFSTKELEGAGYHYPSVAHQWCSCWSYLSKLQTIFEFANLPSIIKSKNVNGDTQLSDVRRRLKSTPIRYAQICFSRDICCREFWYSPFLLPSNWPSNLSQMYISTSKGNCWYFIWTDPIYERTSIVWAPYSRFNLLNKITSKFNFLTTLYSVDLWEIWVCNFSAWKSKETQEKI
jgi:hypothetical protein